jgi:hypothetical protein
MCGGLFILGVFVGFILGVAALVFLAAVTANQ